MEPVKKLLSGKLVGGVTADMGATHLMMGLDKLLKSGMSSGTDLRRMVQRKIRGLAKTGKEICEGVFMQGKLKHNIEKLIQIGQAFYNKNWFLGTSGNLSYVSIRDPLTFVITASGVDKGSLTLHDFLVVDTSIMEDERQTCEGLRPSGEAALHKAIYENTDAMCVIHVHSVPALILADIHAAKGAFEFKDFEIQKGLGPGKISKKFSVPIIENDGDVNKLSQAMVGTFHEGTIAVLIQHHGLFCWGNSIEAAKRHVELLHHIFDYGIERYRIRTERPI